jgi:hypothetical protein
MALPEITQLELGTFRFPDPELADRTGVVMGYAIRHRGGVFLFDTGFGFGNAELDEVYQPIPKRIGDALAEVGIAIEHVTAVANCRSTSRPRSGSWLTRPTTRSSSGSTFRAPATCR